MSNLDRVTPELICHCIGKLKPGKGDGSEGFRSDHLINAGNNFNVLLSLLFRAMVIYGHYPRNLLVSTIISIPKDLKSSLCKVDNYRGISLFNSIAKVFDYVIIELCNDQLIAIMILIAICRQRKSINYTLQPNVFRDFAIL